MTVTTGMKSWGWNRHCFLLPGAGFTVEARHMSFSHRCYFFFLDEEVSSSLSLEERAGSSAELGCGGCTGAHWLKVIAVLVHVVPLCPLQKGETKSHGLLCVWHWRFVLLSFLPCPMDILLGWQRGSVKDK